MHYSISSTSTKQSISHCDKQQCLLQEFYER